MIKVFIGDDSRLPALFNVAAHSIHRRSSLPVTIAPLALSQLKSVFSRETSPLQSTEFSFTRFLVPYLCDYEGWAIFMDNDMLVLDDIAKLWALRDEKYAIQVVKHDHQPKEETKFLNAKQTKYEKKNWSSVVLFNCSKCKALTKEYVNTATGLELHQFKWLESDALIGELPGRWNHLVGYDDSIKDVSIVHYTIGGPYFKETQDCEFNQEWFNERDSLLNVEQKS